jgi:hypothetical protein
MLLRRFARPWWAGLLVAGAVAGLVCLPGWRWSFTQNGINPQGSGINPDYAYGFHVTNLLIHLVNVMLVLAVARRLTTRPWVALLAASIFAVHPVETESVTNIVGRADELSTFWMLLAFWCYLRSTVAGLTRPLWLLALMVPATAGMFSKESGFMLVLLVPLYDFIYRWPKLTGSLWERLRTAIVEFGLKGWVAVIIPALFFLVIRAGMIESTPTYGQLFIDNPIARVPAALSTVTAEHKLTAVEGLQKWWAQITLSGELTAFKVLGRYLWLLVYPDTLSCDYSYNAIPLYGEGAPLWEDLQCWIGLATVIGLLWLAWIRRLAAPLFSFGVLFFFGMILPTANIVFPIGSIMGERFLYLPSIGFCLVAAAGLAWIAEKLAASLTLPDDWREFGLAGVRLGLPLVLLCALGLRTYARNADWKNEFSLWKSAAAAQPNSFKVHKGYANGYFNQGVRSDDLTVKEKGVDDAIARAEIGLAVIDSKPLPINRQDNTLFCDLGMYYIVKARLLMDPKRREGAVPFEAAKFYQKGVDIMIRARNVDTWVNGASRGDRLQRGAKLDEISNVGNPRVHNQLAEAYLGLGNVLSQLAGAHFDQLRRQLDELVKKAGIVERVTLEDTLKSMQPTGVSVQQAQRRLEDLAKTATGEMKPALDAANATAQTALALIAQMEHAFDETITASTYARNLAPNQLNCYQYLSQALFSRGRHEESAIAWLQFVQLLAMQQPDNINGPAGREIWGFLQTVYSALGQSDAIMVRTEQDKPVAFALNTAGNALVRRHYYAATAGILQHMIDVKDFANAEQFRQLATNEKYFNVPSSELPDVPPAPPKSKFLDKISKKVRGFFRF